MGETEGLGHRGISWGCLPSLPSSGSREASGSLTGMETELQPFVWVGAGRGWASGWAGPGSGLTRVYWSTVPAILASPPVPPNTQKPHPGGSWRQLGAPRPQGMQAAPGGAMTPWQGLRCSDPGPELCPVLGNRLAPPGLSFPYIPGEGGPADLQAPSSSEMTWVLGSHKTCCLGSPALIPHASMPSKTTWDPPSSPSEVRQGQDSPPVST